MIGITTWVAAGNLKRRGNFIRITNLHQDFPDSCPSAHLPANLEVQS